MQSPSILNRKLNDVRAFKEASLKHVPPNLDEEEVDVKLVKNWNKLIATAPLFRYLMRLNQGIMEEQELKYALDVAHYETIKTQLSDQQQKIQQQENTYFDGAGFELRQLSCGLRIRNTGGPKCVVTAKFPKSVAHPSTLKHFKIRLEYESSIPTDQALSIVNEKTKIDDLKIPPIDEIKKRFGNTVLKDVRPFGTIRTKRTFYEWHHLVLELDRFQIFEQEFFELEIETNAPSETDEKIKEWFGQLGIPYQPHSASKLSKLVSLVRDRSSK